MSEREPDVPPYQLCPLISPFSDLERDFGGQRETISGPGKTKITAVQALGTTDICDCDLTT